MNIKNVTTCRLFFIVLPLLLLLCACTSPCRLADAEWPERISTDTVQVFRDRVDSVFIHDSINTLIKGDTIYRERWHTAYRYKYITRDSIIIRVDSIPYRVEVIKREPYTPKYMKFLAYIGITMIISFVILILIKLRF